MIVNSGRVTCGQIERYDKNYDRVNTKMPRPLQQFNRVFHNVTTTDDPIIRNVCIYLPSVCCNAR